MLNFSFQATLSAPQAIYSGIQSAVNVTRPFINAVAAQEIASRIASLGTNLITVALTKPVVGQIVGGVSCIIGGSYMVVKSGVSCCLTRPKNRVKKTSQLVVGGALIAVGTTAAATGLYQLYHGQQRQQTTQYPFGVQAYLQEDKNDDLMMFIVRSPKSDFIPERTRTAHQAKPRDHKLSERIDTLMNSCPASQQLYINVLNQTALLIQFKPAKTVQPIPYLNPEQPTTLLQFSRGISGASQSQELQTAMQEFLRRLCTLKKDPVADTIFQEASRKCLQGDLQLLDYMHATFPESQKIGICYHNVITSCRTTSAKSIWKKLKDPYANLPSFEQAIVAFKNNEKDQPAIQNLIEVWTEDCARAYCKKHRKAAECRE